MFEAGKSVFTKAVMDRLVLMINHVIAAEPVAVGRLLPHAGRSVRFRFDGWPSVLPALPSAMFTVTPAGLIEWRAEDDLELAEDLTISVDASNPARAAFRAFTGEKPAIAVAGNAAFAADVNWLVDNLRWDIEDDLARLIGDAPAHQLASFASAVNGALKKAAGAVRGFGKPDAPGDASAPGRYGTGASRAPGFDGAGEPPEQGIDRPGGSPRR